ncbi:MAG: hypothetical protein QXT45_05530 [Candidatus Bilamarchaeaceae archaeon]
MPTKKSDIKKAVDTFFTVLEVMMIVFPLISGGLPPVPGARSLAARASRIVPMKKIIGAFETATKWVIDLWEALYKNWLAMKIPPQLDRFIIDKIPRFVGWFGKKVGDNWWRYMITNFVVQAVDFFGSEAITAALMRKFSPAVPKPGDLENILKDRRAKDVLAAMASGNMEPLNKWVQLYEMAAEKSRIPKWPIDVYLTLRNRKPVDIVKAEMQEHPSLAAYAGVAASIRDRAAKIIEAYAQLESSQGNFQEFIESLSNIYQLFGDFAQSKEVLRRLMDIKPSTTSKEFYEALRKFSFREPDIERIKEADEVFRKINRAFNAPYIEELANLAQDVTKYYNMQFYRIMGMQHQAEKFMLTTAYDRFQMPSTDFVEGMVELSGRTEELAVKEETYELRHRFRNLLKVLKDQGFKELKVSDISEMLSAVDKQIEILASSSIDLEKIAEEEKKRGHAAAAAAAQQTAKDRQQLIETLSRRREQLANLRDALAEGREGLRASQQDIDLIAEMETMLYKDIPKMRAENVKHLQRLMLNEQVRRAELQRRMQRETILAQLSSARLERFWGGLEIFMEETFVRPAEINAGLLNEYRNNFKKLREEFARFTLHDFQLLVDSLIDKPFSDELKESIKQDKLVAYERQWRSMVRNWVDNIVNAMSNATGILINRIERDLTNQITSMIPTQTQVKIAMDLSQASREIYEELYKIRTTRTGRFAPVDETIIALLRNEQDNRIAELELQQQERRHEMTAIERRMREKSALRANILQLPMQMFDMTIPEMQNVVDHAFRMINEARLYTSEIEGAAEQQMQKQFLSTGRGTLLDSMKTGQQIADLGLGVILASVNDVLNSSRETLPEDSEHYRHIHYAVNERVAQIMGDLSQILAQEISKVELGNARENIRPNIERAVQFFSGITDELMRGAERMQFDNDTSRLYLSSLQTAHNLLADLADAVRNKPLDTEQLAHWKKQFDDAILLMNEQRNILEQSLPGGSASAAIEEARRMLDAITEARKTPRTAQQQNELERLETELARLTQDRARTLSEIQKTEAQILIEKQKQRLEEIRISMELLSYGRAQADLRAEIGRIAGEQAALRFGFGAQAAAQRFETQIRLKRERDILAERIMPSDDLLKDIQSMFSERNRSIRASILATQARMEEITRLQQNITEEHYGVLSIEPRTGLPAIEGGPYSAEVLNMLQQFDSAEQAKRALELEKEILGQQLDELRSREEIVNALEDIHKNLVEAGFASVEMLIGINEAARNLRESQIAIGKSLAQSRIFLQGIGLDSTIRMRESMFRARLDFYRERKLPVTPMEFFAEARDISEMRIEQFRTRLEDYLEEVARSRQVIEGRMRDLAALSSSQYAGQYLDIESKRIELSRSIADAQRSELDAMEKITGVYAELYLELDRLRSVFNELNENMRQFNRGLAGALLTLNPADILSFARGHFMNIATEWLGGILDKMTGAERIDPLVMQQEMVTFIHDDIAIYVQDAASRLANIENLLSQFTSAVWRGEVGGVATQLQQALSSAADGASGQASGASSTQAGRFGNILKSASAMMRGDLSPERIKQFLSQFNIDPEKLAFAQTLSSVTAAVGGVYALAQSMNSIIGTYRQISEFRRQLRGQVGWTVNPKKYASLMSEQILGIIGLGSIGRAFGPAGLFGTAGALIGAGTAAALGTGAGAGLGAGAGVALGAGAGATAGVVHGATAGSFILPGIGTAIGAALGATFGAIFGKKLFRPPSPPSRLRRGLQKIFDELGIPRIATGGRGISLEGPGFSGEVTDIGRAMGFYAQYKYPGLGQTWLLPSRMVAAVSNAARSLNMTAEDARALADAVAKRIVPSLNQGAMALMALSRRGKIGLGELRDGVAGLMRLFGDLPPAIDSARLSLAAFSGSSISIKGMERAIEDAKQLIANALPSAFQNAARSGNSLAMLRDIGTAYADIFVARVSERLLQRRDIGAALTEAVALSEKAAEALALGDYSTYQRYASMARAAFMRGQETVARITTPILGITRGIYASVGSYASGFYDLGMQTAPQYAVTPQFVRPVSYSAPDVSQYNESSYYMRKAAYGIERVSEILDKKLPATSQFVAQLALELDGNTLARAAYKYDRLQKSGVASPKIVGVRR